MTPEQQRAIALAKARKRLADQQKTAQSPRAPQIAGDTIVPPPPGPDGYQPTPEPTLDQRIGGFLEGVRQPLEAFNTGFTNMYMLGGMDELRGGIDAAMTGRGYSDAVTEARQDMQGMRDENPALSTAGGIIGAVASPVAQAAMKVFPATGSLGRQVVAGGVTGAGLGATQGFMEGEGGIPSRFRNAAYMSAIGGGLGAGFPVVARGVGHLYRAGQGALRNSRISRDIGDSLGISPQAGRVVSDMVGIEDGVAMQDALRRAGPDAMLGDASPSMGMNLRGAMQTPNPGSGVARQRVDQRAGDAYYDIMDALSGGKQGPQMPPVAAQRHMSQQARGGINDAYQRAYKTPIDYTSEAGRRIEDIVDRLPPSTAKKAIDRATDRMIYDGAPSPQIMASIADDGAVTLTQKPNVIQLDYLKRAFDEIAEDGKDAVTGRLSSDGAFASRIARDLREAVADAVPEYRNALSTAATDIRQRAAVRTGGELLRPQTTIEQAAEAIADATPAELRAMRQGVMGQIDHTLGNVRAVASDQNIEPRQAMQALRELSSPNSQRKMQGLFGDEWPGIKETIDRASAAMGLRAQTAARSDTAANLLFNQQITDAVEPGPIQSLQPLGSARQIGQHLLGSTPQAVSRARDEVKGEIAELLTRQGGAPQKIINDVVKALAAHPANPNAGRGLAAILNALGLSSVPASAREVRGLLQR